MQVVGTEEALGVDLVDALGARGTGCEPTVLRDDLQAPDGRVVARGTGENGLDGLAGQLTGADLFGGETAEHGLLLGRGGCIDPLVDGLAEALDERRIAL